MSSNPYESSTASSESHNQTSPLGNSEHSNGVLSRRTIFICILLLLASAVNYMDRQTLAVTASRIKSEFGLDNVQYGRVEAVFGYSFAFGSIFWGFLVDRFSVRWIYPIGLLGWSLMGFLTGWARDYDELYQCRLLLGIFESAHWPCGLKTTQALLSKHRRAMGNSVLQSGTSIGAILTPIVMLAILTNEPGSWRAGFQGIAIVGALWVFLWLYVVRDGDFVTQSPANPELHQARLGYQWWHDILTRKFAIVLLMIICINTMWQVVRAWLPLIMQENYGFSERQTLIFNSLWYIATDVGCFASGVIALTMANKGWSVKSSRLLSLLLGVSFFASIIAVPFLNHRIQATAAVPSSGLVSTSNGAPGAVQQAPRTWAQEAEAFLNLRPAQFAMLAILLISGAGALAIFPIYYSFAQDVSPLHQGKVTSVSATGGWLASSYAQPWFGWLKDQTGNYDMGLFLISILPIFPLIALYLFWPDDTKTQLE
jgi:ACS family hexuronate transporter-like MFS transporter